MARLTAKRKKKLPKSAFALPGKRKYPVNDRAHAANAKSRAQREYRKGRISKSTRDRIFAKANRKLGKGRKRGRRR